MSRSQNPSAYAQIVETTFLFTGLSQKEVMDLLECDGVSVLHFEKGTIISSPMHFDHGLGIILYGSASVQKGEGTGQMLMSVLKKSDLFGAASLFCNSESYVVNITALQSTWVMMISEQAIRQMFQENEQVMENYIRYLTNRIRFLSDRIDTLVRPSTEERVLLFLSNNAQEDGKFSADYSITALSNALHVSRATLYRAFQTLEEKGKIRRAGRMIELTKEEAER